MPVNEIERMELVGRLSETIGKEAAETLMACTLPEGRDQLATKADFEVLKAGIEVLRADTKADIEVLRAGLEALATEIRAAHAELRSFVEMKLARQARLHYGTLTAFLMSVWGIFLAQNFVL